MFWAFIMLPNYVAVELFNGNNGNDNIFHVAELCCHVAIRKFMATWIRQHHFLFRNPPVHHMAHIVALTYFSSSLPSQSLCH